MRDRWSLLVGLIFLAIIVVATLNTLGSSKDGEVLGLDRFEARWPLPEFAVPAATSQLEGDANVAQDDCGSSAIPCPEDPPRKPACEIPSAGAIRVCDLFDRPLVLSFWFTKGDGCADQQDAVDEVYRRYRGRVNFLSIDVRDSRDAVRELVAENDWRVPVGFDRDGAVGALYRVDGCPTFAYAYPGGTLQSASAGRLTAAQLEARVRRLLAATDAAEGGAASAGREGEG